MKKIILTTISAVAMTVSAQAQTLVAGWDFQGSSTGTVGTVISATPNTQTLFAANAGINQATSFLYLDGTNGSSAWAPATQLNSFGGTSLNTEGTSFNTATTAPASLALVSQTANTFGIVFKLDLTGIDSIALSYATQKTGTGFVQQWSYSIDGINFTNWGSLITPASSFSVQTLPTISALDNAATAYIKLTVSGATSGSGNNRLDNIQIVSVPEPGTVALVGLGLGAVLFGVRRKRA